MSDARRRAEEALAAYDACKGYECDIYAMDCVPALRDLLAEPAPACGSVSTVRSDDPPAAPLPTCANCGSNLAEPAPVPDAVREAAERLRNKMRATYADPRYMNVWATAQERLGPYTGPNWTEEAKALDAALDARPGGERGGE